MSFQERNEVSAEEQTQLQVTRRWRWFKTLRRLLWYQIDELKGWSFKVGAQVWVHEDSGGRAKKEGQS